MTESTEDRIYQTAIASFRQRGYRSTTMRQIASDAGLAEALCRRGFRRKIDIARRWHDEHIAWLTQELERLPAGQMADRYHAALTLSLDAKQPMRSVVAALYSHAMQDDANFTLAQDAASRRLTSAFQALALASADALREPKASQLGIALHAFHLLITLFWLYDRSQDQATTRKLVDASRDFFRLMRPMFLLPMVTGGIARLAAILMPEPLPGAAAQDDSRDRQHQNLDIHRE